MKTNEKNLGVMSDSSFPLAHTQSINKFTCRLTISTVATMIQATVIWGAKISRHFKRVLKVFKTEAAPKYRDNVATSDFSRCSGRQRVAILDPPRCLVAPAASAILLPGPKLAPRVSGLWAARPTRCGGSAARPRMAPMFCRSCPAGPGCGSSSAKLPPSLGSPPAISEFLSDTRRNAWISAMGIPFWGICPSSQVRDSGPGPRKSLGGKGREGEERNSQGKVAVAKPGSLRTRID